MWQTFRTACFPVHKLKLVMDNNTFIKIPSVGDGQATIPMDMK